MYSSVGPTRAGSPVERSTTAKSWHVLDRLRTDRARPESAAAVEQVPFSLRKRQGAWRDALLRRLLAAADVLAVVAALVALGLAGRDFGTVAWAGLAIPLWIVLAKLVGLYDIDQRSLRHLTVDELPRI